MKKLIFLLFLFPFILDSCKDCCEDPNNPDCENYDPCYNYKPANADFGIYELLSSYESETDTIYNFNKVLFKPKNKQDKVTWILGAETISTDQLVRESFPAGQISVTMIAEMNANNCITPEQQFDTITKTFFVIQIPLDSNDYKASPWWGTWEGANTDAPNETFTVSWGFINEWGQPYYDFIGLPKGLPAQRAFYSHSNSFCSGLNSHLGFGYLDIVFSESDSHSDWGGFGLNGICHRTGNTIQFNYRYNNRPYQSWLVEGEIDFEPIDWVSKTFKGHKISNKVKTQ